MSVLTTLGGEPESVETTATGRSAVWSALRRDKGALAGLVLVVLALVVAAFAPVARRDRGPGPLHVPQRRPRPGHRRPARLLRRGEREHWFGVEPLNGRDLFAITVYGRGPPCSSG